MIGPVHALISGVPGSGKTSFLEWLASFGFVTIFNDHPGASTIELAWQGRYEDHGFDRFVGILEAEPAPVVVEYGFHPPMWLEIAELKRRGMDVWWFDGNRVAAKLAWRQHWRSRASDDVWDRQVELITQYWPAFAWLYQRRIIRTVVTNRERGYRHKTPEQICQRMFGRSSPLF